MAEIHHLQYGWVTPTISYALSVLGSLLGLICAVRLRNAPTTGGRVWWLTLAASAIGGTGIWTMHFVAMMGFSVVGTPIRYDVSLTAVSAILAVVTVGIGLAIALLVNGGATQLRIIIGGVLAGLGVAAMHYTGMAAMRLNGHIDYSSTRVGLSVAIAVVAATVALWLAVTVRKTVAILGSALIMGVAVNGMHFTGMSAMSVQPQPPTGRLSGATAATLLIPIGVAVLFGILGLAYALMAAPTDEDRAALAYLAARRGEGEATVAAMTPTTPARTTTQSTATQSTTTQPTAAKATKARPAPARPASGTPSAAPPQPRPATPQATPEPAEFELRPGLGAQLRDLQALPEDGNDPFVAPPIDDDATRRIPNQRLPRRMPSANSSWTARDRADQ
jgi:NO-binding membrane sensor protein with MHYT domain